MFRQLVNAVGRKASAAKLPSDGLRLNASKSESRLVMQCYVQLMSSAYAYAPELETDNSITIAFECYPMYLHQCC